MSSKTNILSTVGLFCMVATTASSQNDAQAPVIITIGEPAATTYGITQALSECNKPNNDSHCDSAVTAFENAIYAGRPINCVPAGLSRTPPEYIGPPSKPELDNMLLCVGQPHQDGVSKVTLFTTSP